MSIDRWLIDLKDQLDFLQPQNLLAECLTTGNEYFCRGVVRNPDGTLSSSPATSPSTGWVARGAANGYRSQSHGWDFQGQYDLSLGNAGRLDLSFNGTLMTLRLAANNIFDKDPPIVPDSRSRIGLLRGNTIMGYDLLGRQLVAGVSVRM
nr:hypothetical protein [uncultured Sphingomonas sp.]